MKKAGTTLFWVVTGLALGFGVVGILSVGLPFLLAGIGLAVFGVRRWGWRDSWIVLVTLGVVDALIVMHTISSGGPPCPRSGAGSGPITCANTPSTYAQAVIVFWCIALFGACLPVLRRAAAYAWLRLGSRA